MQKNIFIVVGFHVVLLLSGCATTSEEPRNVVGDQNLNTLPSLAMVTSVENDFFVQNCDAVLSDVRTLKSINTNERFSEMPPVFQAAVFVCNAKAANAKPEQIQKAIQVLKKLPLRYPAFHEAWVHSTLGDLYLLLNDKQNAVAEKKVARDLILSDQQNIAVLNAQILKIDPSSQNVEKPQPNNAVDSNTPPVSPENLMLSVKQLLNNDSPDQAIALIDSVPAEQKTPELMRVRGEAVSSLVTKLRYRVRLLFNRVVSQTGEQRTETLKQCEQILQGIIDNYPEYSDMSAIRNNLKQIRFELSK